MKFIFFVLAFVAAMGVELGVANGAPVTRLVQDAKFPTQAILERQLFSQPIASLTTYIASNNVVVTSAAVATLSSFLHQPDVPRNLEITPVNVGNLLSCTAVVNGLNYNSHSISETFTFSSGSNAKVVGSKAFKSISSIVWAASCEQSTFDVIWYVGVGEKLGLKRCLANAGDIGWSVYNGAKEATAPTIASSLTAVESNTADFNGTMDGTKNFLLYFVQDFQCF